MSETEKKPEEQEKKTSAATTPTKTTTETKTIDASEVKEHNKKDNIWIILRDKTTKIDKVYDVTKFLEEHPGGKEVLLDVAGKDATQDFEDVGHSSEADELMKKYYIGDLMTTTTEAKNDETVDAENVPVAFTSCFKSFSAFKSKFGFK